MISLPGLVGHPDVARALRRHARHSDQAVALVVDENPNADINDNPRTQ